MSNFLTGLSKYSRGLSIMPKGIKCFSTASSISDKLSKNYPEGSPEWRKELVEKAMELIFGSRIYSEFTLEEKRIVNLYQKKISEIDGGLILLNTALDLEQKKVDEIFRRRKEK